MIVNFGFIQSKILFQRPLVKNFYFFILANSYYSNGQFIPKKTFVIIFLIALIAIFLSYCGEDGSLRPSAKNQGTVLIPSQTTTSPNTTNNEAINNPLSYVYYCYNGIPVELNSQDLVNPSKTATQFSWDFNNDGTYETVSTSSITSNTFSTVGTQEMLLKIDYNDSTSDKIKISNVVKDSSSNHKRAVWFELGAFN